MVQTLNEKREEKWSHSVEKSPVLLHHQIPTEHCNDKDINIYSNLMTENNRNLMTIEWAWNYNNSSSPQSSSDGFALTFLASIASEAEKGKKPRVTHLDWSFLCKRDQERLSSLACTIAP